MQIILPAIGIDKSHIYIASVHDNAYIINRLWSRDNNPQPLSTLSHVLNYMLWTKICCELLDQS
jgi:hypothetical protein